MDWDGQWSPSKASLFPPPLVISLSISAFTIFPLYVCKYLSITKCLPVEFFFPSMSKIHDDYRYDFLYQVQNIKFGEQVGSERNVGDGIIISRGEGRMERKK